MHYGPSLLLHCELLGHASPSTITTIDIYQENYRIGKLKEKKETKTYQMNGFRAMQRINTFISTGIHICDSQINKYC
ncbi:hypothetical protein HanIR_Chr15g0768371 [Helianthus annuus]|nr:hypothetical protein HanIR_Chr15g0768371 [Helianthus annuus]